MKSPRGLVKNMTPGGLGLNSKKTPAPEKMAKDSI